MIRNDLKFVFPDENGERVCRLACQQLSYTAVKLTTDAPEKPKKAPAVEDADDTTATATAEEIASPTSNDEDWRFPLLRAASSLVTDVKKSLDACRQEHISMPHQLDLQRPKFSQLIDSVLWEVTRNTANPGQQMSLMRYVPVDFLQVSIPFLCSSTKFVPVSFVSLR